MLCAVESAVEVAARQDKLPLFANDLVCFAGSGDEDGRLVDRVVTEINAAPAHEVFQERGRGLVVTR